MRESGYETAYKAVMKPKEGTILTVAQGSRSQSIRDCTGQQKNWKPFISMKYLITQNIRLPRTPEMLPVLKEAGVVDSGGQGLLEVLRGAIDGFLGKDVDYIRFPETGCQLQLPGSLHRQKQTSSSDTALSLSFFWTNRCRLKKNILSRNSLTSIGDSIVLVADDEIVKVHVHTNHPGQAI